MSNSNLTIDVENSAGQKQGSGPITSASDWQYTARMSAAGDFRFTMPASDPKAILIQRKRVVRAFAILDNQRVEVGAGIIDTINKRVTTDGDVMLEVGGQDLIRELNYRSVLNLKLYLGGNPVTHAAAVAALAPYAPPGWTFTPDPSPPNNSVYGYFNGDSVLAGVVKTADKSQNQFYRGAGRTLIFQSVFTPSGIRAINAQGDLAANTCAITSLTEKIDVTDLRTRIYPRGSGNAEVQLTLRASNRTMPAGYVMNTAENYIENTAAAATYGRLEWQQDFRDIGPIENTAGDIRSAANMLAASALATLRRLSSEIEQAVYTVSLEACRVLLRPMQSLVVAYHNPATLTSINATLNILEATWSVGEDGIYTTGLKVSNSDRWPEDDRSTLVNTIADGKLYQALPQLNANSYVTAYNKNVDKDNIGNFRFRLGNEITQLQQVFFEFQLLAFESTVKSVGGSSGGSGEIPTTGPNTDATGAAAGANNTSGLGGGGDTELGGSGSTQPSGSGSTELGGGGNTTFNSDTLTQSGGSGNTGLGGAVATNSGGPTATQLGGPTATNPATGDTGGSGEQVTEEPEGGDVIGGGQHDHALTIHDVFSGAGLATVYFEAGSPPRLSAVLGGSTQFVRVNQAGTHVHNLNDHTHDLASHAHSLANHSHTIIQHSHPVDQHQHTMPGHQHTMPGHQHPLSNHNHSMTAHTHTLNNHTHTLNAHSHSLNAHTHTLNNHTHNLSESITAIYGIFRDAPANVFGLADLQYRVNSGAWTSLSTATDAGGGWRRLDITALVTDPITLRPGQENNLLEIGPVGSVDKRATIDAQLSVRNTIQAITYI